MGLSHAPICLSSLPTWRVGLNTCHILCDQCSFCNRKNEFQPFWHKRQYYQYRRPITCIEGLIIRSIHDKILNCPDAIPTLLSDHVARAGLHLYKYYITNYQNLDPLELMVRKHDLFLAILQAGETSEKKLASPIDQALLAYGLLPDGNWRKAASIKSSVTAILWALSAIDAHWCRLAIAGVEHYIPFSPGELETMTPSISQVNPPDHTVDTMLNDLNMDDLNMDDDEDDDEDDEDETGGDNQSGLLQGLKLGDINKIEVQEILQHISRVLDIPESRDEDFNKARSLDTLDIRQ